MGHIVNWFTISVKSSVCRFYCFLLNSFYPPNPCLRVYVFPFLPLSLSPPRTPHTAPRTSPPFPTLEYRFPNYLITLSLITCLPVSLSPCLRVSLFLFPNHRITWSPNSQISSIEYRLSIPHHLITQSPDSPLPTISSPSDNCRASIALSGSSIPITGSSTWFTARISRRR